MSKVNKSGNGSPSVLFIVLGITTTRAKTVRVVASGKGVCRKLGFSISPFYRFVFFTISLLKIFIKK